MGLMFGHIPKRIQNLVANVYESSLEIKFLIHLGIEKRLCPKIGYRNCFHISLIVNGRTQCP